MVTLTIGSWLLREGSAMGAGAGSGVLAPLPLPGVRFGHRGRHLLYEVQRHFRIYVAGRMNWIKSPASPESLLNFLSPATCTTGQLNAVDYHGRLKLLPELKFQLSQIRDEV
jgi:hypothetical protein